MATATAPLATQLHELSSDEILRYSRHLILPDVALDGQQRLKAARVLLIGAGGLGSPLALYLAAAGVGTLGLVDFDVVDVTNLQRQIAARHEGRRPAEARVGARPDARRQPARARRGLRDAADVARTRSRSCATTTSSSTARTTSRRAISRTTRACCSASRTCTAASSASRGRRRCSRREEGPCYRCLFPSRRRRDSCRAAPKAACSACCPGLVGTIQATEGDQAAARHRRAADRPAAARSTR